MLLHYPVKPRQKSYKFKNTVGLLKDVVLRYFLWIYFLDLLLLSNYSANKVFSIKYSVRDLIYDVHVHEPQCCNMRKIMQMTSSVPVLTINLLIPIHTYFT